MSRQVRVEGLGQRYGERAVLSDVDFALEPGERLAVLGRSGAGKTSLLRLIAGLAAPSAGRILLGEREASRAGRVLLPPQRRGVGLVFQGLALWPHMSVEGTLRYVTPGTRAERRARARELAERVGLGQRLAARPGELSGGERQRLALARALAPQPALLLLDEPFAHLDPPLRARLGSELLELLAQQGTTLILVTHARRDALELADRLLVLAAGRVRDEGPAARVLEAPSHPDTVELLELGTVLRGQARQGRLETVLGALELDGADDGAAAAWVRPEQVRLETEPGAGIPARVVRCSPAQPARAGNRYALELRVGELLLQAGAGTRVEPGADVALRIEGSCRSLPYSPS